MSKRGKKGEPERGFLNKLDKNDAGLDQGGGKWFKES